MLFKITLGVIVILVILLIGFFLIFSDSKLIFWYLTSKKRFKYKVIKKYIKNGKGVLFLGTVHDMHFGFDDYGFQHLRAVLLNYQPDVLLIESRQSELDLGNLADGPIEMFYLGMIARELDIPVIGVDWFNHLAHKPGTTVGVRDEHIFNNIDSAIESYQKPLVAIGATHLLIGNKILLQKGYKHEKMQKELMDTYYKTARVKLKFHKDMIKYLEKRIEREQLFLEDNELDENWIKATESSIRNLKRFIVRIEEGKIKLDS